MTNKKKSNKTKTKTSSKAKTKTSTKAKTKTSTKAKAKDMNADVVIITGMSGAGRTLAMHTFEDLGYYVIDNLPPSLILQLVDIVGINSGISRHLAVVSDLRTQGLLDELTDIIKKLNQKEISTNVIFLDASDEELRSRYLLSRRKNPIAHEGEATVEAIKRERKHMAGLKKIADEVVDTTNMKPMEFRRRLVSLFS